MTIRNRPLRHTPHQREPQQKEYPCTSCGMDAFIGYVANKKGDWNGLVKIGERLCTRCFERRGGEGVF